MKNIFTKKQYCIAHPEEELRLIKNDCANQECEKEFLHCRECGLQKGEHL